MLRIALANFLFLSLAVVAFYLIGLILFRLLKKKVPATGFFTGIFLKLLLGFIFSTLIFALAVSGLKTILCGFVLIGFFLWFENRRSGIIFPSRGFTEEGKIPVKLAALFSALVFFYAWAAMILLRQSTFPYSLTSVDDVYYSTLSESLWMTGEENTFAIANLFNADFHGTNPYHYFELWLNALLAKTFHVQFIVSLKLITCPLLNFISVCGLFALSENIAAKFSWKFFLLPLFLFTGHFYFSSENPNYDYTFNFIESPMEYYGEKFSAYYPFIILAFIFFLNKNFLSGILSLLALPFVSVSMAPGVFSGIIIFILLSLVLKRKNGNSKMLLYTVSTATFFILFYFMSGNKLTEQPGKNIFHFSDLQSFDWRNLKMFVAELFYRVRYSFARMILVYLPFVLFAGTVFFQKMKSLNFPFMFCLCIYFSAMIFAGMFYKLQDANQFYTNTIILIHVLLIVSILLFVFSDSPSAVLRKIQLVAFITVIILLCVRGSYSYNICKQFAEKNNYYSEEYLAAVSKITLPENANRVGVFIKSSGDYERHESKTLVADLGSYLSFMPQFLTTADISIFEIKSWHHLPHLAESEKNSVYNSVFFKYTEKLIRENKFKNTEQVQLNFVEEFKIKYVLVSPSASLPQTVKERADKIIEDEKSHQKFVLLK